jgi:hypothetical protein
MRKIILTALLLLAAAPTPAQRIGARTQTPEQLLGQLGLAPSDEDLAQSIAAADAHPLGSRQNPVRVGGPEGEQAYIARLRCSDGRPPRLGQRTSSGVGAFGTIVDAYPLDCGQAAPGQVTLIMDMYHSEHVEHRAPPGFTIAPR